MPANFSGTWKCEAVGDTGDFGDFLKLISVPWFIRKIAKFDRYGAGKEVETISMESAQHFRAVNNGPRKVCVCLASRRFPQCPLHLTPEPWTAGQVITQEFAIDGSEQIVPSIPDGADMQLTATWEGETLVLHTQVVGASHTVELRRSLDGGKLRLEMIAAKLDGSQTAVTSRVYAKTADAGEAGWGTELVEGADVEGDFD